jgi:hypothetical protein
MTCFKIIYSVDFESVVSVLYQWNALTIYVYIWHYSHVNIFRYDNAIFREYIPSLKPQMLVKWITPVKLMTFSEYCREFQFYMDELCEFSIAMLCRNKTQWSDIIIITIRHLLGLDRPVSVSSNTDYNVIYIASAFGWYIKRKYWISNMEWRYINHKHANIFITYKPFLQTEVHVPELYDRKYNDVEWINMNNSTYPLLYFHEN